jgi:membrane dipeptidase
MAYNVLRGRDYDEAAAVVQQNDDPLEPRCMVTLPELRAGGVALAFGTLYTGTNVYDADGNGVYREPPADAARRQLDVYLRWEDDGEVRIVRDRESLECHLEAWAEDGKLGIVVLIEGGDSISAPESAAEWFDRGVRIVGPAWTRTRYCGGTRFPGGLTDLGRELVNVMRDVGLILDVSHMAEQSFWDAMTLGHVPTIASHSNARALVHNRGPLLTDDRHMSDEMIAAVGERDGVIGLNLFSGFLVPDWEAAMAGRMLTRVLFARLFAPVACPVTLDAVRAHAGHIASIVGWHRVGIGSDIDGGLGVDETPVELDTAADLVRIGDVVPPEARAGMLGENWLRFLRGALP